MLHPEGAVRRALAAEAIGTALLVATVIGSGIMAERLANGNGAVALLGNTAATVAVLFVLITTLGPVSGASFNPAVTAIVPGGRRVVTIAAQILGGIGGMLIAHAMFAHPIFETGVKPRAGIGQWLGELVATFGLLLTIRLGQRYRTEALPALVAAWIAAAYWFTSSTSFANPAVTIARALTDSFSGIRPVDAPAFVVAQLIGAWLGWRCGGVLIGEDRR